MRRSCVSIVGVFGVGAGALYAQVPDDLYESMAAASAPVVARTSAVVR